MQEKFILLTFFGVLLMGLFLFSLGTVIFLVHQRKLHRLLAVLEKEKDDFEDRTIQELNRDIHDSIGQRIFFAITQIDTIDFETGDERIQKLDKVREMLTDTLEETRDGVDSTGTYMLENEGLEKAIHTLLLQLKESEKYKVSFEVLGLGQFKYDAETEKALYRIFQEAIRNIIQHSQAHTIGVTLESSANGTMSLRISDDGIGIDPGLGKTLQIGQHSGLKNMEVRAMLLGGRLSIENAIPKGTVVKAVIPKKVNR